MIIDTSALIAVLTGETGFEALKEAIIAERGAIPAPVYLEFIRVANGGRFGLGSEAQAVLVEFERRGCIVLPFTPEHAKIAANANILYGSGNRTGGTLNILDLMVYAVAKERAEPLLCTGKDFAATDIDLHAASRPY